MPAFWVPAVCLLLMYYIWIGRYYYGWLKLTDCKPVNREGRKNVSIIVPVRDEEHNIRKLLNNLLKLDYPSELLEIIIVDDHSVDDTPDIVRKYAAGFSNIHYYKMPEDDFGKKAAIREGVRIARNPVILTTDADCIAPPQWVSLMVDCFNATGADLIAGPVLMEGGKGFFSLFQELEFLSLQAATAGSIATGDPIMCSSANLGFKKDAYSEKNDPANEKIVSGDDVFLLFSIHRSMQRKIIFLKSPDAAVTTGVHTRLSRFLEQRKRWASKVQFYKAEASLFTALLVFLIHIYAVACLVAGFFFPQLIAVSAFIILFKSILDFPFLYSVAVYYGKRRLLLCFPLIQAAYFVFVSYTAISSLGGTIKWKGRTIENCC
jgi:cellulose synthase/poly-beta-1,6-N-acetylglucosamine synthase-like glycosyltransferase